MLKKILLLSLALLVLSNCVEKEKPVNNLKLFVGTYTDGTSKGIYSLEFNPETGTLDSLKLMAELPNPSFLAISEDKKSLYAVQETADFDSLGGGVTAFSLDGNVLKELNSTGSGGAHPCHVALSNDGQLAVSNYTGGNLAIFNLEADGSLGRRQLIDHNILDTTRTAHVHKAHFKADGLFAADLGLDVLRHYTKKAGKWEPAQQHTLGLDDGAGPRHFVFNSDGSNIYVINELSSTITVFELDDDDEGYYSPVQTESTLADDYEGDNSCADIHLSPDGRFLYGSNRGENTVVIFSVDEATGRISLVGRESVRGDRPRNFTISPNGNNLLVANQKSNNVTVFKRNTEKGTLQYLNEFVIGAPVCLMFN